jgi:hypothetical protein
MKLLTSKHLMHPATPQSPLAGATVSVNLTNCTDAQAIFMGELGRLFSDPANEAKRQALEQGTLVIGFGPKGTLNLMSNPAPVISGDPKRN